MSYQINNNKIFNRFWINMAWRYIIICFYYSSLGERYKLSSNHNHKTRTPTIPGYHGYTLLKPCGLTFWSTYLQTEKCWLYKTSDCILWNYYLAYGYYYRKLNSHKLLLLRLKLRLYINEQLYDYTAFLIPFYIYVYVLETKVERIKVKLFFSISISTLFSLLNCDNVLIKVSSYSLLIIYPTYKYFRISLT